MMKQKTQLVVTSREPGGTRFFLMDENVKEQLKAIYKASNTKDVFWKC